MGDDEEEEEDEAAFDDDLDDDEADKESDVKLEIKSSTEDGLLVILLLFPDNKPLGINDCIIEDGKTKDAILLRT
jgi:hypothetical protein